VNKFSVPLVSVVLAARDAELFVRQAVESILRQSVRDLELVVIDDGSHDSTPKLLAGVADPRLVIVRNEEPKGLAAALNRGFEEARGKYVARMDADDVALPDRLALQLARLRSAPRPTIVGGGVAEIDGAGRIGAVHVFPPGVLVTRWLSLFGTPFFHPSVVVEREALERHGLQYDPDYDAGDASTEDYDLWARLLEVADGDNVGTPVLLYRRHEGQASERRAEHQLALRRRIALRGIAAVAPALGAEDAELAWLVGDAREIPRGLAAQAVDAHLVLLAAFADAYGGRHGELSPVRRWAARAVARVALRTGGSEGVQLLRHALALDPLLAARVARGRLRRRRLARTTRDDATPWLAQLGSIGRTGEAPRVTIVSPEPTPFRSLMFDWMAKRPELDLTVVYAGRTIASRTWTIIHHHRAVFLRGLRVPGASRLLLHDYPVTLGIFGALADARPDVVVVSGWSTFACQAAMLWCRAKWVPYLLLVESHDIGPRSGWRRAVKGAIVPRAVRGAARVLVIGRLARESVLARGGQPERIAWFANTIDVVDWGNRADRLAGSRSTLRAELGAGADDLVVLSVARLVPEKGLDTLVRAAAGARDPRLIVVVFGQGQDGPALERLAGELGVRLRLVDDLPWERVVEAYVAADIFALLSTHEPWGVVVNEAAACGLPLVLSDRVGAAYDLLRDGENGALVPSGDVKAAAAAIQGLATDQALRLAQGARSRELMREWGYEPSVESFVAAVREAIASR
jgi:glycosyltransferase involved in cell wall biosynthesis